VILLDVNVVLAAHRADHPHHAAVRPWFDGVLAGSEPFAVPDAVWASFVRIATNRRIFTVPTPIDGAFSFLRAVRAQPGHRAIVSGAGHLALFEQLCCECDAPGDLAADAYLAALAIEQGATLVSLDRDFARFSSLRWRVPGETSR
jgi:toxin-antitoxin system PIN domain toxin